VELQPKEELSAPEGYHWIEDNWTLDETGPWVDDVLGLGNNIDVVLFWFYLHGIEIMVSPENGGWVYTDTNWENPRHSSNKSLLLSDNLATNDKSVTRRRRWIRKCERNTKK
jgi:hypothetical protein